MSKVYNKFTRIINLTVCFILACNIFDFHSGMPFDYHYHSYVSDSTTVLSILRYIMAHFVLLSEINKIKPFYLQHFTFFMFPMGRALAYGLFAILSFSTTWYGITSISIIGFFAFVTLCTACKVKDNKSPYIPIEGPEDPSNPDCESGLPSYQPLPNNDTLIPTETLDIKVVSN